MPRSSPSTAARGRPPARRFETTSWTTVLRAAPGDAAARPALAELCRAYWYPLYAYARRRGFDPPAAEDGVQGFLAWLLESGALRYADPARGRFRGFLVAAFRQYLAREHERATARKRCPAGGVVSIDAAAGEERYARELADGVTPDRLYDAAWALSVIRLALDQVRAESVAAGRGDRFDAFQGFLTGQSDLAARDVGAGLGLSEGAVRVAVHRMRQRFGEVLRDQVAATLAAGESVDDELRALLAALAAGRGE